MSEKKGDDEARTRRLVKLRDDEMQNLQALKNLAAYQKEGPRIQFETSTTEIPETALKKETVGLVSREQYLRNVSMQTEEEERLEKLQQEEDKLEAKKRRKMKKRGNPRLSFSDDIDYGEE